ncbi:MAG: Bax inhibitor-1 family protein [Kiloniellales bacterium]
MTRSQAEAAGIDVGLRDYMLRVYNYMALGVAFTGAVAMIVAMNPVLVQGVASMFWLFFIGILGLGFFAPRIMMTKSVGAAQICFWVYASLWGALLGPILLAYAQLDPMIIVRAFFITAGTFAGVSLYGYVTKRDLSPFATFFMMAVIGLLIAIVVNAIFIQSVGFSLLTSVIVVLLFSGITAWETQIIKSMYYETEGHDVVTRKAIFGAFLLYGSFVTLFVHILNILGIMRGE